MITFLLLLVSSFSLATSDIKCEANYNELGIPYQKTNDLNHFYYCFGYHHGRDRAWEMDYFRRVGQGRNAEVYGYTWLKSDLMMRLLDLPSLASRLYQELPDENKVWLENYSRGVNQGFVEGKRSHEFLDKGYEPEEWKPVDSLLVLTLQSFDQTRKTFFRDYEEEKSREHWKEKTEALFNEDNVPWMNTILKEGEYIKKEPLKKTGENSEAQNRVVKLWSEFPDVFGKESGSNNWVISKAKSKTGNAILANDPHLDLKTPLFWYWVHFETPHFKVMGASVPGVPVVASGTNGKVAWGLTNSYINTADAVFVRNYPENYFETIRPRVYVKVGFWKLPFIFKTFERTRDGDLVLPLELESEEKMLLKWTGFKLRSQDLVPMFNFMHARDVASMDRELQKVGLPSWNFVFADNKGDIGYRVVGQIYRSTEKDSYGIPAQTLKDFRQDDLLDPMERPHVLKPNRNYIYTANNRHFPVDANFYGGRGYSYSFRGYRIEELLSPGKHDVASFKAIQCDRQAVDARFFTKKILKYIQVPEFNQWNFETTDATKAAPMYRRLMDLMMDGWKVNEYALFKLLEDLKPEQKIELGQYLEQARKEIGGRNWGDIHRLTFAHISKNGDWNFSPEIPGIGDHHSVDPGTLRWDEDRKIYEQFSGASMRMIIEMKEVPEIHLSLPGLNRQYTLRPETTPAWNEWRACEYRTVKF